MAAATRLPYNRWSPGSTETVTTQVPRYNHKLFMIYFKNVDFSQFWQKWVPPKMVKCPFDYKILFSIEKQ